MSVLVEARSWRRNVPRNGGPDGQRIRESVVVARATTRHLMRPTETDHARHEIGSDPESMWLRREARDFADVDLARGVPRIVSGLHAQPHVGTIPEGRARSEEHTSELQSHVNLVCRLLLEKKKKKYISSIETKKKKKKKKYKK